jgi:hypothetical protein
MTCARKSRSQNVRAAASAPADEWTADDLRAGGAIPRFRKRLEEQVATMRRALQDSSAK